MAAEPAPEPEKHTGTCTSHSALALAVELASRERQLLPALVEQEGLCLSQNSPQPKPPLGPMEDSSQHCSPTGLGPPQSPPGQIQGSSTLYLS